MVRQGYTIAIESSKKCVTNDCGKNIWSSYKNHPSLFLSMMPPRSANGRTLQLCTKLKFTTAYFKRDTAHARYLNVSLEN